MANVLEVERLHVRLGDRDVLKDLTFAVPEGSTLAIIGPNGSGKTVLFRTLVGSLPYEGVVRWRAGVRLGYVPQKLDLERDLPVSGLDLLRAKASIARVGKAEMMRVLGRVDLSQETASVPLGTLSGGQFQRLLLAFALIGAPDVLLLDEPTAGVDEPGQMRLYELLRRLKAESKITILLISHELNVVYRYAESVLCLGHAKACFGPPHAILAPEMLERMYGEPVHYHAHEG